ncbi:MAG TPA: MmcQ/YjbR family DNA-binding protein [Friedmanniella sp.]
MATLDEARRIALDLPGTSEKVSWGTLHWRVRDVGFAWERPLRKTDLAALGDAAPTGEIVGVRVADLGEKDALVAAEPDVFFTIPHLDGYPAVLVRLAAIDLDELTEVITDAWLDRAPKTLRAAFLAAQGEPRVPPA